MNRSPPPVLRRTGQAAWSGIAWAIWPGFLILSVLARRHGLQRRRPQRHAGRPRGSIEQARSAREQRAEVIATAQRAADTVMEARKAECAPRGPRCRDREADER